MTDFRSSRHDEWDGVTERRRISAIPGSPGDPITREYLDEALAHNRHSTKEYINTKITELEGMIRAGFPGGDPVAHCAVHQGYIDEAAERRAFWKSVFEKIATGAIYAAVVAVAMATWQWIKSEATR